MRASARRIISESESEFIRFQLVRRDSPREVKAGLQRLCTHYEAGRRLVDSHEHRQLVQALLGDPEIVIRRWALKAIAHVGLRGDLPRILACLHGERDLENQTWAMTAAIALGGEMSVGEVCAEAGVDETASLELAARLFAHNNWIRNNRLSLRINIEKADDLTLKWAALLSGYGRADLLPGFRTGE